MIDNEKNTLHTFTLQLGHLQYIAARRQVKKNVKQEKNNKELSIPRICKHNPKSLYSYINERRIVRDNIGPLKTPDGNL